MPMSKNPVTEPETIGIVGAGSWGTALGVHCARKGVEVRLWGHNPEHLQTLATDRQNQRYLKGHTFPPSLSVEHTLNALGSQCSLILMVVPSHGFRAVFEQVAASISQNCTVISAVKGIENDSLMTMSQVMFEVIARHGKQDIITTGVLCGPSFAKEVARKVPTAVTIGCHDQNRAAEVQSLLTTDYFRVYTSHDVIGLEISGALKNIVAIAAGICDGLEFGFNARAALITRGLAELARFGVHLGAQRETFYGLSGVGDLVLTCTGDLSRNRSVGIKLGQGKKLEEILGEMEMVAEGIKTTKSVYNLATRIGIEMPILEQVYQIIYHGKDCRKAVNDLLERQLKPE